VQKRQSLLVARVGLQPQRGPQHIHVVVDGRAHRRLVAIEVVQIEYPFGCVVGGVVELVAAHPNLDVGLAQVLVAVLQQGTEARDHVVVVVFAHQVADEVRPVLARQAQLGLRTLKLALERVQQDQPMIGCRAVAGSQRTGKQRNRD
jgi:hypothetical protein